MGKKLLRAKVQRWTRIHCRDCRWWEPDPAEGGQKGACHRSPQERQKYAGGWCGEGRDR